MDEKNKFFLVSDKLILKKHFYYTASLNFLEGRYVLKDSINKKVQYFNKRADLIRAMTKWRFVKLVRFYTLVPDKAYYIEARARIKSIKLYPPFSFLAILSFETDWKRSGDIIR